MNSSPPSASFYPPVTVAVPLLNEARHLPGLLDALLAQTYPRQQLQILLLDGGSDDGTLALARAAARNHTHISVHANIGRVAAAALNKALSLATGRYLVRFDARCRPAPDYIALAVQRLQTGEWAGVAGPQIADAPAWPGTVYAEVLNHALGTGAPAYRRGNTPHASETLFLGAYDCRWLQRVGGWDEYFAANEDFELNWRLRQAGARLLVDPAIRCRYLVRDRLADLARQYARYGAWRVSTWRRHPRSLRLRHMAPAMLSMGLAMAVLAAPWTGWPLLLLAGSYLGLVGVAALDISRRLGWAALPRALAAFMVIHLAWGLGFWSNVLALGQGQR